MSIAFMEIKTCPGCTAVHAINCKLNYTFVLANQGSPSRVAILSYPRARLHL